MTRQKSTVREPMLDGGRGIGIVGEGYAVLPLPGAGSTGNEFEGFHAFDHLAGVVEVVQARGEFDHSVGLRAQGSILGVLGVSA